MAQQQLSKKILKGKISAKDRASLENLMPLLIEYLNEIMPVYAVATPDKRIELRQHNPTLDTILRLMEGIYYGG